MMLLLLDLSNEALFVSLYQERHKLFSYTTLADKFKSEEEYLSLLSQFLSFNHLRPKDIDGALLSSVVPSLTTRIKNAVSTLLEKPCLLLNRQLKTGLAIRMDNPSEVGSDLIASALGAINDYQKDCLVIDLSSVLSFTLVTKNYAFLGGLLFPGMQSSSQQMVEKNALLLEFEYENPKRVIGKSTKESLNNGILLGYQSLIESVARKVEEEYGSPLLKVVTGQDVSPLRPLLPDDYIFNPDLIFDGLYDIYLKNVQ